MREPWAVTKNRILCSRPFLALHVLMGRPLIYRIPYIALAETLHLPARARVVGIQIKVPPGTAGVTHDAAGVSFGAPVDRS